LVYSEIRWLQEQGIRIWYDEGISGGRIWRAEIGKAIEGAAKVLYYISTASVASDHCNREISVALDEEKPILPVYLESAQLTPDLKIGLARLQAIHRTADQNYQRHLLDALEVESAAQHPQETAASPSADQTTKPMIAVMPFDRLSGDAEQDFFSEGIAEDILNGLAHSPDVVVRARNSSFSFKGQSVDTKTIAERLNVTHIVNGSVRTSGNRVRVNARLTAVDRDVDVWSDRFDREVTDLFTVQDDVAKAVLAALDLHFSRPERQRVSLDAYNALLMGRYHFGRFDVAKATEAFEKAVEIKPDYAEALSNLGYMYGIFDSVASFSDTSNRGGLRKKARAYWDKALEADPDAAVPPDSTASLQQRIDHWILRMARHPNSREMYFGLANVFRQIGRSDLEIRILDKVVALDPLTGVTYRLRGDAKLFAGVLEEALEDFQASERFGHIPSDFYFAQVAFYQRDSERLEELTRPSPGWTNLEHFRVLMAAGAHYLRGNEPGVEQTLAPLEAESDHVSGFVKFWIALLKGQHAAALAHYLDAVRDDEFPAYQNIRGYAGLRALFPDYFEQPGYAAMLREFGFDSAAVETLIIPELPF